MKKPTLDEAFTQLYPEPTVAPTLDARLASLVEQAAFQRTGVPKRTIGYRLGRVAGALVLLAVVSFLAMAGPKLALAIQLFNAARLLQKEQSLFFEWRNGKQEVLSRSWIVGKNKRSEEGKELTLWRDGALYTWRQGQTSVLTQKSVDPPRWNHAPDLLRLFALHSLVDTIRRQQEVTVERVQENGQTLRRITVGYSPSMVYGYRLYFPQGQVYPERYEILTKRGQVKLSERLRVQEIPADLVSLPQGAVVVTKDQARQDWLAGLAKHTLASTANVAIRDAAIAPSGDLYVIYTEPLVELWPNINPAGEESYVNARVRLDGYALLRVTKGPILPRSKQQVFMLVFTPLRPGGSLPQRVSGVLKTPQGKYNPPYFPPISFQLPLRRLPDDEPEYSDFARLDGNRGSRSEDAVRLQRLDARFRAAVARKDWSTAKTLSDAVLAGEERYRAEQDEPCLQLAAHLQSRATVLDALGQPEEARAAREHSAQEKTREY